jgi:hypothetical protein
MICHVQRGFHVHDQGFLAPRFTGPCELKHPFILMGDVFFQRFPDHIIDALQNPRLREINLERFATQPSIGQFQRVAQMGAMTGDARASKCGWIRGGHRIDGLERGQESIEPAGRVGGFKGFEEHLEQGIVEGFDGDRMLHREEINPAGPFIALETLKAEDSGSRFGLVSITNVRDHSLEISLET